MLLDLVKAKVKDDSGRLTDADDYQPAIDGALERYSRHKPKVLVVDVLADLELGLPLPSAWVEEFSTVQQVEFPVGQQPPVFVDPADWYLYRAPQGWRLYLVNEQPLFGTAVRLTITTLRNAGDIPAGDQDAVTCLAAAACLETLASLFVQTSDPTIQADVVNYRTKSGEAAARAKRLRQLYHEHIGIDAEGGVAAAGAVTAPSRPARGRLTH